MTILWLLSMLAMRWLFPVICIHLLCRAHNRVSICRGQGVRNQYGTAAVMPISRTLSYCRLAWLLSPVGGESWGPFVGPLPIVTEVVDQLVLFEDVDSCLEPDDGEFCFGDFSSFFFADFRLLFFRVNSDLIKEPEHSVFRILVLL